MIKERVIKTHGLTKLKVELKRRSRCNKVKLLVKNRLDLRFPAARALLAERDTWIADRGGIENFSGKELTLLEHAVRSNLYIQHLDHWLLAQSTLVNHNKRSVVPVLKERQSLVDSLAKLLSQLGLERKEKPVPTLQDFIREHSEDKQS